MSGAPSRAELAPKKNKISLWVDRPEMPLNAYIVVSMLTGACLAGARKEELSRPRNAVNQSATGGAETHRGRSGPAAPAGPVVAGRARGRRRSFPFITRCR